MIDKSHFVLTVNDIEHWFRCSSSQSFVFGVSFDELQLLRSNGEMLGGENGLFRHSTWLFSISVPQSFLLRQKSCNGSAFGGNN